MGEIKWTRKATRHLEQIHRYIAADKPIAARKLVEEIYHTAKILQDFPEIGHHLADPRFEGLRVLLYGHYRIVYRPLENGNINVIGVYHGAMDLKRYLEPS